MARIIWLLLALLFLSTPVHGKQAESLPLYVLMAGGEEAYEVPPKTTINRVAQEKGVQWTVVARENELKKPFKIQSGMILKLNNTHIVPTDLSNGFVINLPELLLYYFKDGVYQRRYALAVGKPSWPTPTGNYQLCNKSKNPTWTVPVSIQEEMFNAGYEVVEKVPPGPKNPLGQYWMGTTASGVGIHATNRPWSVGHFVSHGCIRMLPDEIAQLFPLVEVGLPVKITYRPVKVAVTPQGRIFLEAHPNIYRKKLNYLELVKELAQQHQIVSRLDWDKVAAVLKAREGIARDVTKVQLPPDPATKEVEFQKPREMGLFPLQGQGVKLE